MLVDSLSKRAVPDNGNATYVEDANKKSRTDYFTIAGSGEQGQGTAWLVKDLFEDPEGDQWQDDDWNEAGANEDAEEC